MGRRIMVHRLEVFFAGTMRLLGTLTGGIYLILLYLLTLWMVVGSLSAIQVRDRLAEGAVGVTYKDVERAYDQFQSNDLAIWESYFGEDAIELKTAEAFELDRRLFPAWASSGEDWNSDLNAQWVAMQSACESPQTNAQDETRCELVARSVRADRVLGLLQTENYLELERYYQQDAQQLRAAEPLAEFFDTYEFFRFVPLYREFLNEPREILVIQLTMAMGLLGTVVTMTWSYVRRDSGFTLRRFMILPAVGAMSAFIVLILTKAGQITLTAGTSVDALNPFFLSFLGIMSGLLSERAYARMSEIGTNFFSVQDDTPRWGLNLGPALADAGVTVPDLARYLHVAEDEAEAIVIGRSKATESQQRIVAAALRRSLREIFSDQPPDAPVAARAAASPPTAPDQRTTVVGTAPDPA